MKKALPNNKKAFRAFFIKRFLSLLGLTILFTTIGMIVLYAMESKAVQMEIISESTNIANLNRKNIEEVVQQARSDLDYLTALVEDMNVTISSAPLVTKRLSHLCLLFMQEKPIYDQIRIIDTKGHEVLRIGLGPNGPEQAPTKELQNLSDKDYVQAALGLPRDGIYVSRLDLNLEHGEVQQPPKPILRFAMPVFSGSGQVQGVVVLNLLGSALFKDMLARQVSHNVHAAVPLNTMMVDAKGYWVYNPMDPSKDYGFMYPDKKTMTMAFEHPQSWADISNVTSGMHLAPNGLYIFKTVDAAQGINGMKTGPGYPWKVMVFTSTHSLATVYGKLQKKFFVPYAFLIALLAIVSWFLAEAQTRNRSAEARIAHLAHHDHLTGLANRALFHDLADLALSTAERNGKQLALLFLDLDRFKPINDTLGHAAGDEALRAITKRIQACVRKPDVVSRLGGDEFAVILQDVDGPSGALKVAHKIIDAVSSPLSIKAQEQSVGVSIGISLYPGSGSDIDTLLKLADNAMYRAKGSGGGKAELGS